MKTILVKHTIEDLYKAGYRGAVFAPLEDDLNELSNGQYNAELKPNKQRTLTQNRAIHKYCTMLADDLNGAGYDMKKVIKQEVDIPWNGDTAKEFLWRPIQKALKLPESTTELATNEVSKVYEVLSRHLSEKFNISTPFPNRHGE